MIEFIRGTLAEKASATASVEAHGVGYEITIPFSTFERLPAVGEEVKLYTHYHVREDAQKLYGFLTRNERELFRQLIAVSSIGPKTAIGILSRISADDLVKCLTLGDPTRLTKIPGVGAKTAQRLIMELRGKLKIIDGDSPVVPSEKSAPVPGAGEEAFEALLSLGYNDKQVARAIERVRQVVNGRDEPVEEWIRKALQVI